MPTQGVTFTITADTAEAVAQFEKFHAQAAQLLQNLPMVAQSVGGQLGAAFNSVPAAASRVSEGLSKLRETSLVAREGFHGLENAVMVLSGQHFPALIQAVTAGRMALMTVRSTSLLTGASLATVGSAVAGIGAVLGAGALIWKAFSSETERAAENAKKFTETLEKLPSTIGNIKSLIASGVVSSAQGTSWLEQIGALPPSAQPALQMLTPQQINTIPSVNAQPGLNQKFTLPGNLNPDGMTALQDNLVKQGYLIKSGGSYVLNPQIEGLQKLRELQSKVAEDGQTGFNKERMTALQTFKDMTDAAEKYAAVAGKWFKPEDLAALKEQIRANYSSAELNIRFKERSEAEKQAHDAAMKRQQEFDEQVKTERADLERQLTMASLQGGNERSATYEQEYQKRMRLYQEELYSGVIAEKDYNAAVEEATIKRLEGRQRAAEQDLQLHKLQEENQKRDLELRQGLIEADPYKTEVEKAQELLPLLQKQHEILNRDLAGVDKQLGGPNLGDKQKAELTSQRLEILQQMSGLQSKTMGLQDLTSLRGQFRLVMTDLGNQWGTWSAQIANSFKSVFENAISAISSGITGLIMGTERWGRALMQIGTSILTSIVQSIIEMGIRWVMTQVMMAVAGKAIAASNAAALEPIALAQSAIWAAPAALATIASYGGAADAAPGLIAAAIGITQGESAAGFAEGGFTGPGGRNEPAGIVHRGEYVFSAPAVKRIGLGRLQAMHDGGAVGSAPARAGQPGGSGVNVHVWESGSGMANYIKTHPQVQHEIVTLMGKNAYKIR
jgi:hypothetical protein